MKKILLAICTLTLAAQAHATIITCELTYNDLTVSASASPSGLSKAMLFNGQSKATTKEWILSVSRINVTQEILITVTPIIMATNPSYSSSALPKGSMTLVMREAALAVGTSAFDVYGELYNLNCSK